MLQSFRVNCNVLSPVLIVIFNRYQKKKTFSQCSKKNFRKNSNKIIFPWVTQVHLLVLLQKNHTNFWILLEWFKCMYLSDLRNSHISEWLPLFHQLILVHPVSSLLRYRVPPNQIQWVLFEFVCEESIAISIY
jgi:hypothetical protein